MRRARQEGKQSKNLCRLPERIIAAGRRLLRRTDRRLAPFLPSGSGLMPSGHERSKRNGRSVSGRLGRPGTELMGNVLPWILRKRWNCPRQQEQHSVEALPEENGESGCARGGDDDTG